VDCHHFQVSLKKLNTVLVLDFRYEFHGKRHVKYKEN